LKRRAFRFTAKATSYQKLMPARAAIYYEEEGATTAIVAPSVYADFSRVG
jgi:hypothetical protein